MSLSEVYSQNQHAKKLVSAIVMQLLKVSFDLFFSRWQKNGEKRCKQEETNGDVEYRRIRRGKSE